MTATGPTDYAPVVLAVARKLDVPTALDGGKVPITEEGEQWREWRPDTDPRDSYDLRHRVVGLGGQVIVQNNQSNGTLASVAYDTRFEVVEHRDELIAVLVAAGQALGIEEARKL